MKECTLIVFGGKSCEHDISVLTGILCYQAYPSEEKLPLYINRENRLFAGKILGDLHYHLGEKKGKADEVCFLCGSPVLYAKKGGRLCPIARVKAAINCCHGRYGEDGALQGLFQLTDIPFTGSDLFASALCMDKIRTKTFLQQAGFCQAEGFAASDLDSAREGIKQLGYPVIVKPSSLGSSIGISVARSEEELARAVKLALAYDDRLLVERYLEGAEEYNCAALSAGGGLIVSAVDCPKANGGYYTFDQKYLSDVIKKDVPPALGEDIRCLTGKIYRALGLSGVARVDYLYCEGKLYVGEINTVPGSLAYYLFERQRLPLPELLLTSVAEAVEKAQARKQLLSSFPSKLLKTGACGCKGGKKMI